MTVALGMKVLFLDINLQFLVFGQRGRWRITYSICLATHVALNCELSDIADYLSQVAARRDIQRSCLNGQKLLRSQIEVDWFIFKEER